MPFYGSHESSIEEVRPPIKSNPASSSGHKTITYKTSASSNKPATINKLYAGRNGGKKYKTVKNAFERSETAHANSRTNCTSP